MEKRLMLGNEAVARGLYEAGCEVVSSYPGTPSTEITEFASKYDEIKSEWAPNEKVALEVALGASIAGVRSFCGMKHVGLNVAADPLFTASYSGVNAGLIVAVADDQGMHSSQNEQDSRHYAIAAKLPMLEPADSQECKDYVTEAYSISEQFDTPVLLRLSTRISHTQTETTVGERKALPKREYIKNAAKYVMMPGNAKKKHVVVEERTKKLTAFSETTPLNTIIDNGSRIGVISAGIAYQYAAEALEDKVNYLKLGMLNPLPVELIKNFAADCEKVYVVEELDGVIETHCRCIGVPVIGKELFSNIGELDQVIIREKILGVKPEIKKLDETLPVRPPVLCPGCPHRGVFYVLGKLKVMVSGDIGCYTLGAVAPLNALDTTICMGASISGLHGFNLADENNCKKSVAVIGDSTFIHSGITGLINVVYNATNSVVIIMDNSTTGMTGHQQNPTTGFNIKGDPAAAVSLEKLCESIGIRRVRVVDPMDIQLFESVVKEELEAPEPSVIISRRPCALLKTVKKYPPLRINTDKCKKCKACFKIGCPAIQDSKGTIKIDPTLCVGCRLCVKMCNFTAIEGEAK